MLRWILFRNKFPVLGVCARLNSCPIPGKWNLILVTAAFISLIWFLTHFWSEIRTLFSRSISRIFNPYSVGDCTKTAHRFFEKSHRRPTCVTFPERSHDALGNRGELHRFRDSHPVQFHQKTETSGMNLWCGCGVAETVGCKWKLWPILANDSESTFNYL